MDLKKELNCYLLNFSWKLCQQGLKKYATLGKKLTKAGIGKDPIIKWSSAFKLTSGLCCGIAVRQFYFGNGTVHCEAARSHNRLAGVSVHESDPPFDWLQFFELLRPYLKELLAAIAVSTLVCSHN